MNRREFIPLIGGAAAAWPVAAHAQQTAMPVIGFLHSGSPELFARNVESFRRGLNETGFVEGGNVAIEYRWARAQYERLPELAADLVRHQVAVIAADGTGAALAAKAATSTIPIVFMVGADPVEVGLVTSLNRPSGNMTGISMFIVSLDAKRVELLRELVPTAATFGLLINPKGPPAELHAKELEAAARIGGQQLIVLRASTDDELGPAFTHLVQRRADALIVVPDPFFDSRRDRLVEMAARHAVPSIYGWREFPAAGGLMSYGIKFADVSRQLGGYVGRLLKGAKPGDLPVEQPTRFELVVNLKTATSLGLTIPTSILLRADEVIE
jgi:putative tryptophan/tyrosine transport system substrate-binding protein